MKKVYTIILFVFTGFHSNAQIVNIPDTNFYKALLANGVNDSAGYITIDIAKNFDGWLNVRKGSISDLTGIAAFTSITYLICDSNQLTSLNLSSNTALNWLNCSSNNLTNLVVSYDTALTTMICDHNALTSLDISTNLALVYLQCEYNNLTRLDVSSNTSLNSLSCFLNNLTNLNISYNTALTFLYCYYNNLTSLDVSSNTALTYLNCSGNNITSLDVSSNTALTNFWCYQNSITSLDLTHNVALHDLNCFGNSLSILNVKNGNNHNMRGSNFYADYNPLLTCIEVDTVAYSDTAWTNIDSWAHFSTNCNYPNAVKEIAAIDDVNIYPNPATNQLTIHTSFNGTATVSIINVLGQEASPPASLHMEREDAVIDVSNLSKGVYFVSVVSEQQRYLGKFAKE